LYLTGPDALTIALRLYKLFWVTAVPGSGGREPFFQSEKRCESSGKRDTHNASVKGTVCSFCQMYCWTEPKLPACAL
jgi:hypothetical protein